jgi:transposase-like protein
MVVLRMDCIKCPRVDSHGVHPRTLPVPFCGVSLRFRPSWIGMLLAIPRSMDWPRKPLERVPPSAFKPRHCPRQSCPQHHLDSSRRFSYTTAGSYTRKSDNRTFPRFRCLSCRSRFIQTAFTASYYLKRPELLVPIAAGLNAGSAHRQIARSLGCAPSTVTRLAARLGRHALLLQALALEQLGAISEPVALDHFETFVFRQEEALGLATPTGQRSWFVYGVDPAPHRRGGRRTKAQEEKLRTKPVRFRAGAYKRSTDRVLDLLLSKVPKDSHLRLISDDHPAYRKSLVDRGDRLRVDHSIYPNPKRGPKGSKRSPEARLRDRMMKVVDVLHGLIRHSGAHYRRESIAFGRRTNAIVERIFLMIVWRNFVKKVTERKTDSITAAMRVGLTTEQWSWERALAQRLFPTRVCLPPGWAKVYRREWFTPSIGPNAIHRLKYAY